MFYKLEVPSTDMAYMQLYKLLWLFGFGTENCIEPQ